MIGEEPEEFLAKLCREMNEAVCRYGDENKIRSMGTTAAVLLFGEEAVPTAVTWATAGSIRYRTGTSGRYPQITHGAVPCSARLRLRSMWEFLRTVWNWNLP